MTIKAVVFDVGGVLERVEGDTWPQILLSRWERRMKLQAGHASAALAEHQPPGDLATGAASEADLRDSYARALGLNDEQAHEMMAEMWDAYCGELDVELRDFVAGLRPQVYHRYLEQLCDGARREDERRHAFEQLVHVLIYSHEVGVAKPDAAIFQLTEERLGVQPHEIAFLDDRDEHVQAARTRGWHAHAHRDTAESIKHLNEALGRH